MNPLTTAESAKIPNISTWSIGFDDHIEGIFQECFAGETDTIREVASDFEMYIPTSPCYLCRCTYHTLAFPFRRLHQGGASTILKGWCNDYI